MVKYTQTICRLLPTNCLSVFDHFMGLVLERLRSFVINRKQYVYFPGHTSVVKTVEKKYSRMDQVKCVEDSL